MNPFNILFVSLSICVLSVCPVEIHAEVVHKTSGGFEIRISRILETSQGETSRVFVEEFGQWWDSDHSYSGKPGSLSIDLERHCIFEQLPEGGFVRHMEVVFYHPGKAIRMTGGLGPLQEMGVNGAMTFTFKQLENGKTEVELVYIVAGNSFQSLDKIAPAVDGVLEAALKRLVDHIEPK